MLTPVKAAMELIHRDRPRWAVTPDLIRDWEDEFSSVDAETLLKAARHFRKSQTGLPTIKAFYDSLLAVRLETKGTDEGLSMDRIDEELRVQRFMRDQPKQLWNGQEYDAPYNDGLRKRALSESTPRKLPPWYDPGSTMAENLERKRAYDHGYQVAQPKPAAGTQSTMAGVLGDVLDRMDDDTPF